MNVAAFLYATTIIVGAISSGHGTRYIYNMDLLECKAGIGTKFVNILRYNPNIEEPRFFHLLVKKEGEKYVFYKDSLYKEIVGTERIKNENININQILSKEKNYNYENIFYMTEINKSPFIKKITFNS